MKPGQRKRKGAIAAMPERAAERSVSMGIWAWLAIVEKEADKLSEGGQSALALLREDLERLARR